MFKEWPDNEPHGTNSRRAVQRQFRSAEVATLDHAERAAKPCEPSAPRPGLEPWNAWRVGLILLFTDDDHRLDGTIPAPLTAIETGDTISVSISRPRRSATFS